MAMVKTPTAQVARAASDLDLDSQRLLQTQTVPTTCTQMKSSTTIGADGSMVTTVSSTTEVHQPRMLGRSISIGSSEHESADTDPYMMATPLCPRRRWPDSIEQFVDNALSSNILPRFPDRPANAKVTRLPAGSVMPADLEEVLTHIHRHIHAYTTLHFTTIHYTTVYYTTLPYTTTLLYSTLHSALHYPPHTTLHYTTHIHRHPIHAHVRVNVCMYACMYTCTHQPCI